MLSKANLVALSDIYGSALDAMVSSGPSRLSSRIKFEADERNLTALADPSVLVNYLADAPIGDALLVKLRLTITKWDAATLAGWVGETAPRTLDRRALIYQRLEIHSDLAASVDAAIPVASDDAIVISRAFEPWYQRVMAERSPFYWAHYADYLAKRLWQPEAIAALDLNTTRIVERLADPERTSVYQAKGLVVGYVQSGKTANFTGVIAKAVDAGYRLIVVLSGTTNLLRAQTQRRLDKELVGYENLMRGIDETDEDALATVDYIDDPDWSQFVRHDALPSTMRFSDIHRLTTQAFDYKALKQGIAALDFEAMEYAKPLNASENLHRLPTRIAVIKKNKSVLKKFVQDLKKITAKLSDIPVLIIDDESDQASINTSNPARWAEGHTERTAINGLIAQLLGLLPRGQYIGYTATPFANVFVDPGDAVDIFPRDFIISLDRPPGYMGASDYHDFEPLAEGETANFENSNERAFVRPIDDDTPRTALQEALDMYVLTGAVKLFRERADTTIRPFEHHTMLVHESHKQENHRMLAEELRELWKEAGYLGAAGHERLEKLFVRDVQPVIDAREKATLRRAEEENIRPVVYSRPSAYADLKSFVSQVVARVEGAANDPVMIVNGDKEAATEDVSFDKHPVWRILVGGTKLSRGFTIEGLTVAYYRRVTRQADTLMQMGRWFGFRAGYEDLVRLYISTGGDGTTVDLYEAFEAACRSEELFRAEIKRYAKIEDGVPAITPAQVQPLVAQHLGWLKPSASNKMYNAMLVERRSPGERLEPAGYPEAPAALAHNTRVLLPLVTLASKSGRFVYPTGSGKSDYPAFYGVVDHQTFVAQLTDLRWQPEDDFAADLKWLSGLFPNQIEDWVVILPQHKGPDRRSTIAGNERLSVFGRRRRRRPRFGAISSRPHRFAPSRIAGVGTIDDPLAESLHRPCRGSVLIYPVLEQEETDDVPKHLDVDEVVMALVFFSPTSTGAPDRTLVSFVARDTSQEEEPIVEAS